MARQRGRVWHELPPLGPGLRGARAIGDLHPESLQTLCNRHADAPEAQHARALATSAVLEREAALAGPVARPRPGFCRHDPARQCQPHAKRQIGTIIGQQIGCVGNGNAALGTGSTIHGVIAHRADGLVLINTLRKQNAQVEWINTLEERLIGMGGMPLVLDVLRPVLSGVDQLEKLRPAHLPEEGYTPWPEDHPRRRLAEGVKQAQWDIAWHDLSLPVLVMTGLKDRLFRIQSDVDELTARLSGLHNDRAEYQRHYTLRCAHSRRMIEARRCGTSSKLFHAVQQAPTMSS